MAPPTVLLAVFMVSILAYGAPQALADYGGSVSLDRSTYPVPFGGPGDAAKFRYHDLLEGTGSDTHASDGAVTIYIQISDRDFDTSANADALAVGPGTLAVEILRGAHKSVPASAAGLEGTSIRETSPASGIFEVDLPIRYDDGPPEGCPAGDGMFRQGGGCLLSGDTIMVRYTDPDDADGNSDTVAGSAAFDLRNGTLESHKDVAKIGSDIVLTLTDPDLDLDSGSKQSYPLDLIAWRSDPATLTMGPGGGHRDTFNPEPLTLEETGDGTGIFEVIIEIPVEIGGSHLDRGEMITLEYIDRGPGGADFVGQESLSVSTEAYTSDYGATVMLDQRTYAPTDRIPITIVAPDHNFDHNQIEHIGSDLYPLSISTGAGTIERYRLEETGFDTGVFRGEVTLTGSHRTTTGGITGPTDGVLPAGGDDRLTISFKYSLRDELIRGFADIGGNTAGGGRGPPALPVDQRMSVGDPRVVDSSGSVADPVQAGRQVQITADLANRHSGDQPFAYIVTMTNPDGTKDNPRWITGSIGSGRSLSPSIPWTPGGAGTYEADIDVRPSYGSGDRLAEPARISITVGGDAPAPEPGPPAAGRQMAISDPRVTDSSGSRLSKIDPGDPVQLTATFENTRDEFQEFTYVAEIQKGEVSDRQYLTTQIGPKASVSPGLSWIPGESGTYMVTIYARESIDGPGDLAAPVGLSVEVRDVIPPTEKLSVGSPSVGDGAVKQGQKVDVTSKITNKQDRDQRHVYIVQVADEEGTVVYITWSAEDVGANEELLSSVPWVPERPGRYEITTYVWSSLVNNPEALAPPARSTVVVG